MHAPLAPYLIKLNNEGKRSAVQGFNLKLMGMCQGASDLFLAYPVGNYHGLWLEVKRNMSYSSSQQETDTWMAQDRFLQRMRNVGYKAERCFGWEDGKNIIENYLNIENYVNLHRC